MPESHTFTIEVFNHVTHISRGDDVVGHIVPTYSGYVGYVFSEEAGDFLELISFSGRNEALQAVKDAWAWRFGYVD